MFDIWHFDLLLLGPSMMESELSLRVGNQMLPFLLLLTSGSSWSSCSQHLSSCIDLPFPLAGVNAQYFPGDLGPGAWEPNNPLGPGAWEPNNLLEGDYANDGQDDYLDYLEQEQLGDTAPNHNIRVGFWILPIWYWYWYFLWIGGRQCYPIRISE